MKAKARLLENGKIAHVWESSKGQGYFHYKGYTFILAYPENKSGGSYQVTEKTTGYLVLNTTYSKGSEAANATVSYIEERWQAFLRGVDYGNNHYPIYLICNL